MSPIAQAFVRQSLRYKGFDPYNTSRVWMRAIR